MDLKQHITDVPDFPKKGIVFKDIGPLLANPIAFREAIGFFADVLKPKGIKGIAGIEARGFIFGSVVAYNLNVPFIPIRKKGKLPGKVLQQPYGLEYGTDSLEIQQSAIPKGDKVAIIDDVLATGGTAEAATVLLKGIGAVPTHFVGLIELPELLGRVRLQKMGVEVQSCLRY